MNAAGLLPRAARPSLFLLDGYALIYRAFFAMINRPLTTSSGENTSAPYGIARFLMRLIDDHAPDYLGVVFDAGDSFRTEIYPDYKATREKMPDELRASLPRCREVFDAFRVPVVEAEGWEADDVIGTLAREAAGCGLRTVIVSGDKDFHQLVDVHTALLNPGRGGPAGVEQEWVTPENAEERFGVPPERVTDFLALLGDTSDNVPGVPGIGKKTAPELIHRFGDLESILERAEEVTASRARNALLKHADDARRSKALVTIRTDAPVELDLESLRSRPLDTGKAAAVFRTLEFHNLLRELEAPAAEVRGFSPDIERVADTDRLGEVVAGFAGAARLGLFVVGSSDDPLGAELVGVALAASDAAACYLPLGHRAPEVQRDVVGNPTLALDAGEPVGLPGLGSPEMRGLCELLASETPKIGHDLKYAVQLLRRHGVELGGLGAAASFDTRIASYCIDPARRDRALSTLAPDRAQVELETRDGVTGTGRNRLPMASVEPSRAAEWAGPRAALLHRLAKTDGEELERTGMSRLFTEVEMPLLSVLASMERAGIAIDLHFFADLRARLRRDLDAVREEIHKIAGAEVNLRSVPQMRALLFDQLALPVLKKTKTGPSTDESVLEQLATMGHQLPRLILEHRELDKLDGTYVSVLPRLIDAEGRIHTRFNQTVAATGRLSSSDPNLQNIPIRRALGREIRKGFVAAPGHAFVSADYSQIELRVMAHLSGDEAFVTAFRAERDIHRETAARILGVAADDVTPTMREQAKTINFATIYGQGPFALAQQLGISRAQASEFIAGYFERFAGVAAYLEEMKEVARRQGYVETLIGRRRYVREIHSRNPGIRGYGERTATNSPIQGSAADLIKVSMIRLHHRLADTEARMLLQVHDELLIEAPEADVEEVSRVVREEMEGAVELAVPLRVDLGIGRSWYDCKFGKEAWQ
ncbi:DNA polymerase I [Candidatus Palauibacter sp.]|uniref:DNA polymerase I n=1 Tax=Candidatus Palauibacter sp. TaxID=3101350 RepID=UPI003C703BFE